MMKKNESELINLVENWTEGLNAFPTKMIQKLIDINPEDWQEVTLPHPEDVVYVHTECESGNIIIQDEDTGRYFIELDDGRTDYFSRNEFDLDRELSLPMWGMMWQFGNVFDDYWLRVENGLEALSKCGFRVYYSSEFDDYFFGIDDAGSHFYTEYWIPLYQAKEDYLKERRWVK